VVICPPSLFLSELGRVGKNGKVALGVQNISAEASGALTGQISASMAKSVGAGYVIVGHSECREAGESDELINQKVRAALKVGLKVILCIGERVKDEQGEYLAFIKNQLTVALEGVPKNKMADLLVAYEPLWAIGEVATGVETPAGFLHNALFVRKIIDGLYGNKVAHGLPILYGGSVDKKNARSFLTDGAADGLLVGRASLEPINFAVIIKSVQGHD
jgi:triosephosphate isomerase